MAGRNFTAAVVPSPHNGRKKTPPRWEGFWIHTKEVSNDSTLFLGNNLSALSESLTPTPSLRQAESMVAPTRSTAALCGLSYRCAYL